jgi:Lipid A core - O-antigen ligase and related enzymes
MYGKYIIFLLMLLPSFAAGQGELNWNMYIKQFAFAASFSLMVVVSLFLPQKVRQIQITWGDIFVIMLLATYSCFYIGTSNNLDFTQPFIGFLFYFFIRITVGNHSENIVRIFSQIVPFVILTHIVCCLLQFYGIIPSFHGFFKVGSTFGNPDMLGAYLAILLPFCFIGNNRKILGLITYFLSVILLFLIQARTAIVAVAVVGILYLLLSGKISKKIFLFYILLPAISGLIALIWWHPESVVGRLFVWWISLRMFFARPTGWGLYAFEKHYPEFQADYLSKNTFPDIFHPEVVHSSFNEFFNIGVTMGVVGLAFTLLLVAYLLFASYKERSLLLYPACAFLTISMTYFPLSIAPVAMMGILLAALINGNCSTGSLFVIRFNGMKYWMIPLMISVILLTWNNYHVYHQWQTAFNTKSNERFEKIYPSLKGNGRYLITWAREREIANDSIKALSLMKEAEQFFCDNIFLRNLALACEKNGDIEEAKLLFDKAVNMVPGDFNSSYVRILFLQRIELHEEAYQAAIKLYQQPVRSKYYADPFIIKSKLKKIIQTYSQQEQ